MLKRNLALALFISLTAFFGRTEELCAQDSIIFTANGFIGLPDTVYAGDSIPVGAILKNISSVLYNDTLAVGGYIDTGATVIPFSGGYYPQFQLQPDSTQFVIIPIAFHDVHQGGPFRIGNNVIVVWPMVHGGFVTGDSISQTVFVIDTISSTGPERENDFNVKCYPVPSSGPLYITSDHPSVRITQIVVHDADGKLMASSKNPSEPIDIASWPPGMYVIEATFENGKVGRYKILRR